MRFCPNCQKPYPEEDFLCPDCGYSPDFEKVKAQKAAAKKEVAVDKTKKKEPVEPKDEAVEQESAASDEQAEIDQMLASYKPYKEGLGKAFWLSMVAGVVIASLVVGLILLNRGNSNGKVKSKPTAQQTNDDVMLYEKYVEMRWKSIANISDEMVKKQEEVTDQASLDRYSAFVTTAIDKINNAKDEIGQAKEIPTAYKIKNEDLVTSIDAYVGYLKKFLALISSNSTEVGQEDFEPLDVAGVDAKKKSAEAGGAMEFLEKFSDDYFALHTKLIVSLYERIWQANAEKAEEASASKTTTTIPNSSRTAKETIVSFSESYTAGAYDEMDEILADGEAEEQFERRPGIKPYKYEILNEKYQTDYNTFRVSYYFKTTQYGPYFEDWTLIDNPVGDKFYITGANLEQRHGFTPN